MVVISTSLRSQKIPCRTSNGEVTEICVDHSMTRMERFHVVIRDPSSSESKRYIESESKVKGYRIGCFCPAF